MRISDWSSDVCSSDLSLTAITADREQLADQLEAGRTKVVEAKAALDKARDDRATARQALVEGDARLARRQRHAPITDARQRHTELLDLEKQLPNARHQAAQEVGTANIRTPITN